MTTQLKELLQRAAHQPGTEVSVPGLLDRIRRRRRQRRLVSVLGVAIVLGVTAGLVAIVRQESTSKRPSVQATESTAGVVRVENQAAGVSIAVPSDWMQLPLEPGAAPSEIVAVGTAPRPGSGSPCGVGPSGVPSGAVYVLIAEYPPGDPGFKTRGGAAFPPAKGPGPRPRNFADAPTPEAACTTNVPGQGTTVQLRYSEYRFRDRGRRFDALVVGAPDATAGQRKRGIDVLNGFRVDKPAPVAKGSRLSPNAIRAIRAAFLGWLNTRPRDAVGKYVEDFDAIRDSVVQAAAVAAAAPSSPAAQLFDYTGSVDHIEPVSDHEARVWYHRKYKTPPGSFESPVEGQAVKIGLAWKVSRDTACTLLARSGPYTCPPQQTTDQPPKLTCDVTAVPAQSASVETTCSAENFPAIKSVTVTIAGSGVGQFTTDETGRATLTVRIPAGLPPGEVTISASGGGREASTTVRSERPASG